MQQPRLWFVAPIHGTQSICHQRLRHVTLHGPAHDFAGVQIFKRRQIQPTLVGGDVGDVGDPHLAWRGGVRKLPIQHVRRDPHRMRG